MNSFQSLHKNSFTYLIGPAGFAKFDILTCSIKYSDVYKVLIYFSGGEQNFFEIKLSENTVCQFSRSLIFVLKKIVCTCSDTKLFVLNYKYAEFFVKIGLRFKFLSILIFGRIRIFIFSLQSQHQESFFDRIVDPKVHCSLYCMCGNLINLKM